MKKQSRFRARLTGLRKISLGLFGFSLFVIVSLFLRGVFIQLPAPEVMPHETILVQSVRADSPQSNPLTPCSENAFCTTNQANHLEQKAQQLYQQGKFTASASVLDEVIALYQTQNDPVETARALRNLGLVYLQLQNWQQAETAIASALLILKESPTSPAAQQMQASTLNVQGQLYLALSQPEKALDIWKDSADLYQQLNQPTGWIRSRVNQTQALQALGLYSQALKQLTATQEILAQQPASLLKAKALQSLGDVLREVGQPETSRTALQESLILAKQFQNPEQIAMTLISLGNTVRLESQFEEAVELYQLAISTTDSLELKLQAQLNALNLFSDLSNSKNSTQVINVGIDYDSDQADSQIIALISKTEALLDQLPESSTKIQGQINLAQSLIRFRRVLIQQNDTKTQNTTLAARRIADHLTSAIQGARQLEISRLESYGLGILGHLYEEMQQWDAAQQLTEQALILSQGSYSRDIAYQWQWQLGRILQAKNDNKNAVLAYSQAVETLKSLRNDIVVIGSEVQFNFREQVEPVYRELVSLLLEGKAAQTNLRQARDVIESLQLAELDNFFQDACSDSQPLNVEKLDPNAAIVYTILLPDRLEVIVAFPDQTLSQHTIFVNEDQVETVLQRLSDAISIPKERVFIENFLEPSEEIYSWLVRPLEDELETHQIENLVFILDGKLRNVPIASLYDGQNYLIERYGLALTPSLQLIEARSSTLNQRIDVLSGGLSAARQGFPPLPAVELELEEIRQQVEQTKTLLNESFTEGQVNTEIAKMAYTIVHLATHGEFSSDLENTFVLTWDGRINIEELRRLLKSNLQQANTIDLLILSACQTALGDNRAGLGLAGMAVRSGARSTLASLWSVEDESTSILMRYFYQALKNSDATKIEALRLAQRRVLQERYFDHPYFWSAFVLVGDWR
ncbi:MAG: CHAT domain-containing protein [Microcoleaceae cyanobacterium]